MRISDWSSDVCSSDLAGSGAPPHLRRHFQVGWTPVQRMGARPMPRISRRALLLAAPALVIPRVLAAAVPTPRQTEGPFYPTELPADDDSDLVKVESAVREAGGDILELRGRVLDQNARPAAGLRVEIWQCDVNGVYLHRRSRNFADRDGGFQGFGHAVTDEAGRSEEHTSEIQSLMRSSYAVCCFHKKKYQ